MKWISIALILAATSAHASPNCRANLEQRLCYADDALHYLLYTGPAKTKTLKAYQNRTCLKMPENRKAAILAVYDAFPAEVKLAFCEMKRIFLVRGAVDYGARAEYFLNEETVKFKTDPNTGSVALTAKPEGFILEISEANRFKGETGSAYTTRVTQGRFGAAGGAAKRVTTTFEEPFGEHGALATTILHEVGHMLARASGENVNLYPYVQTQWTSYSWNVGEELIYPSHGDSTIWERITSKSLTFEDATDAIGFLKSGGLTSLYGASNPDEDFAESFMFHFFPSYKIFVDGQTVFDLESELQSDGLHSRKREHLRNLLSKSSPFSLANAKPFTRSY